MTTDHPDDDVVYPTTPVRIGESVERLAKQLASTRAAQEKAKRRFPGRFEPEERPAVSNAARDQERWEGIVGANRATWRLHNLDETLEDAVGKAEKWLKNPRTPVLLIGGTLGCGKTALACATAHSFRDGGRRPVVFAPVEVLVRGYSFRDPETEVLQRRLANVSSAMLVILDDLGTSAPYAGVVSKLHYEIDRIVGSGARLIVTSNLTKKERSEHLDPRVRDRVETGATEIRLPGRSLRGRPIPVGPPTGPCPFDCHQPQGLIFLDEHPDAVRLIENMMAAYGHVRVPDEAYDDTPEGRAMKAIDRQRESETFDFMGAKSVVFCPHCRPEKVPTTLVLKVDEDTLDF